jgi:hypothetical protein
MEWDISSSINRTGRPGNGAFGAGEDGAIGDLPGYPVSGLTMDGA